MQFITLLVIVVGFVVGVGWRSIFELPIEVVAWFLVMALAAGVVWRRKSPVETRSANCAFSAPSALLVSIFLLTISLGILRTEVASWQFGSSSLERSLGGVTELIGVVIREPDYRERTVHLYIETGTDIVLVTADGMQDFLYGDEVTVKGKIERPEVFETDLGRTFDYPGYLKARGVEYKISFAEVEVVSSGKGNSAISLLLVAKKFFIESLQQIIPEPAVGLGNGLLLGVKSALGEDIENDFRRTGIIHIVVLSGYNVMLVVAFILFCFSFFLPLRARVVAGIVAIIAFALIVGLSATVVRASVMAVLVLLAQVLGRRYDVLRALLLAGTVMLIVNPYLLIYDIGFQLSFMATLGLVLIVPQLESAMVEKGKVFGLREFFLATVATQIAVLPLLMYHIGEVSLIAVVVNMLVLPVVPAAMLLTFITGVLGFVWFPLAIIFGYMATLSLKYILLVAGWFADLPFAAVTVPAFSATGVFLLYGFMLLVWFWVVRRKTSGGSGLKGWTVEEEEVLQSESHNESSAGLPTDSKLPIFFRK